MPLPKLSDPALPPSASGQTGEDVAPDYTGLMGGIMQAFSGIKDPLVQEIAYSSIEAQLSQFSGGSPIHIDRPDEIELKKAQKAARLLGAQRDLAMERVLQAKATLANMDPAEKAAIVDSLQGSDPAELLDTNPDAFRALWNGRHAKQYGFQLTEGDLVLAQPGLNLKAFNAREAAANTEAAANKANAAASDEQYQQETQQYQRGQRVRESTLQQEQDVSNDPKKLSPLGQSFQTALGAAGDFSGGDTDTDTGQGAATLSGLYSDMMAGPGKSVGAAAIGNLFRRTGGLGGDIADVLDAGDVGGEIADFSGTLGADGDAIFQNASLALRMAHNEGKQVGAVLLEFGSKAQGINIPAFEAEAARRYQAAGAAGESWQQYLFGALYDYPKPVVAALEQMGIKSLAELGQAGRGK